MRTTIALTALALTVSALPAGAVTQISLTNVAASDGYSYEWSATSGAAVLSRPGTIVVLRPGEKVYQVNGRLAVADSSPRFRHGRMYVSLALSNHLAALARRSPSPANVSLRTGTPNLERIAQATAPAQGSLSLETRQLQGAQALSVSGTAPANAPVTITLFAIVSPDVPTIVVSRHDVTAGADGRFDAVIPIASAYERGTLLQVTATSSPGVSPASSARFTVAPPNAGVAVPLDSH